jgi:hypothetical protein
MKKPGKKAPAGYVNPHADDNLKELSRLELRLLLLENGIFERGHRDGPVEGA